MNQKNRGYLFIAIVGVFLLVPFFFNLPHADASILYSTVTYPDQTSEGGGGTWYCSTNTSGSKVGTLKYTFTPSTALVNIQQITSRQGAQWREESGTSTDDYADFYLTVKRFDGSVLASTVIQEPISHTAGDSGAIGDRNYTGFQNTGGFTIPAGATTTLEFSWLADDCATKNIGVNLPGNTSLGDNLKKPQHNETLLTDKAPGTGTFDAFGTIDSICMSDSITPCYSGVVPPDANTNYVKIIDPPGTTQSNPYQLATSTYVFNPSIFVQSATTSPAWLRVSFSHVGTSTDPIKFYEYPLTYGQQTISPNILTPVATGTWQFFAYYTTADSNDPTAQDTAWFLVPDRASNLDFHAPEIQCGNDFIFATWTTFWCHAGILFFQPHDWTINYAKNAFISIRDVQPFKFVFTAIDDTITVTNAVNATGTPALSQFNYQGQQMDIGSAGGIEDLAGTTVKNKVFEFEKYTAWVAVGMGAISLVFTL